MRRTRKINGKYVMTNGTALARYQGGNYVVGVDAYTMDEALRGKLGGEFVRRADELARKGAEYTFSTTWLLENMEDEEILEIFSKFGIIGSSFSSHTNYYLAAEHFIGSIDISATCGFKEATLKACCRFEDRTAVRGALEKAVKPHLADV